MGVAEGSLDDGVGSAEAGGGAVIGVGDGVAAGGFTGTDDAGVEEGRGGSAGAVSVPTAFRIAAMNASADCGG